MATCNDYLMRGVVLAPGWARDLREFAHREYGACSSGWLLTQVTATRQDGRRRRTGLREVFRRLVPAANARRGSEPAEV